MKPTSARDPATKTTDNIPSADAVNARAGYKLAAPLDFSDPRSKAKPSRPHRAPGELPLDALDKAAGISGGQPSVRQPVAEPPPSSPLGLRAAAVRKAAAKQVDAVQVPAVQPTVETRRVSPTSAKAANPSMSVAVRRTEVPEGYVRLALPSGCVPYDFDEVYVRSFKTSDLAAMSVAVQRKSFSSMLDALGRCIVQDIRVLTSSDLRFLMYWWRLNSFTRSPYRVSWLSRYGGRNTTNVEFSALEIRNLKMTREEYETWLDKGVRFPTVRDAEAIGEIPLGDEGSEKRFLAERAQYVLLPDGEESYGEAWFDRRIAIMNDSDLGYLEDIRDFAALIEHGVVESIKATDSTFAPRAAADHLMRVADSLEESMAAVSDAEVIDAYVRQINDFREEAAALREKPEDAKPREEVVAFQLNAIDFFSSI